MSYSFDLDTARYATRRFILTRLRPIRIPHFVSLLLIWLVVRETKQVSLENIGSIFDVPTRNLILYRVKVHLPYFFKRYILWRDVDLVALEDSRYRFAAIRLDDTEALPGSREEQPG